MVKFSKQMELQLVPEWRHKFCDYWQLKKLIKRIKMHKARPPAQHQQLLHPHATSIKRSSPPDSHGTSWTPLSSFTRRTMHPWAHEDIIKVHEKQILLDENGGCGYVYETEILEGIAVEELEKDFFKSLDEELNKVNQFFFAKEHEFLERAEILSRQLASLTHIHQAYSYSTMDQLTGCAHHDTKCTNSTPCHACTPSSPQLLTFLLEKMTKFRGFLFSTSPTSYKGDTNVNYNIGGMESEENSTRPLRRQYSQGDEEVSSEGQHAIDIGSKDEKDSQISPKNKANKGKSSMYDEEEDWALDGLFSHTHTRECGYDDGTMLAAIGISSLINALSQRLWESTKKQEEHSIENLNKSKSNKRGAYSLATQNSFKSSMANVKRSVSLSMRSQHLHLDDNCVSLQKIKHARKMLRAAFVEFYRGLGLLQTFSSLNILAFSKILKKYDKVTGRQVSTAYMRVVEKAHFNTSDKVVKMMDEVEKLFTEQFAKDDEKKAMMLLRPVQNEAPHTITFFLGLFSGSSIALLMAIAIMLQIYKGHTPRETEETYSKVAYQVFGFWPGCYFWFYYKCTYMDVMCTYGGRHE